MTSRKGLSTLLKVALFIGFVAATGWFVHGHWRDLSVLGRVSLLAIGGAIATRFVAASVFHYTTLLGFRELGAHRVRFWELFAVSGGGTLASAVVPLGGGLAFKGVYFRKRHDLGLGGLMSVMTLQFCTNLVAAGVFGAAALAVMQLAWGVGSPLLWLTAAGTFAIGGIPLFVDFRALARVPGLGRMAGLATTWNQLTSNKVLVKSSLGLSALRTAASFVGFALLYASLAAHPHAFVVGGMVDALTAALKLVKITPENIGPYEWIVAGLGSAAGFSVVVGLLGAAVFRAAGLLGMVAGALVGVVLEKRRNKAEAQAAPGSAPPPPAGLLGAGGGGIPAGLLATAAGDIPAAPLEAAAADAVTL